MFKSAKNFIGLDDFFYTSDSGHRMSGENIKKRIAEIDWLYKPWEIKRWKFSPDGQKSSQFQTEIVSCIDAVSASARCYILGLFDPSIAASSIAVEMLLRKILEVKGLIKPKRITPTPTEEDIKEWYPMNRVGDACDEFVGEVSGRLAHIVRKDGEYVYFNYPSLKRLIKKADHAGIPSKALLTQVDNSSDSLIFVARRDQIMHGKFETLGDLEQIYVLNRRAKVDYFDSYMAHQKIALEQYKMASDFFLDVIAWFDSEFGVCNTT